MSHEHRSIRELDVASDLQRRRLDTKVMHVLDGLRKTMRLEPVEPPRAVSPPDPDVRRRELFAPDDVRVTFTDESARLIAPLVKAADMLGDLQPKHLAALRALVIDYIGRSGYIEEFTRVIQNDTVTIEELMVLIMQTADHAEMVEASLR